MSSFLFFPASARAPIYTLSLHDALPISPPRSHRWLPSQWTFWSSGAGSRAPGSERPLDRKSTRLNSSHVAISYAVFCLKKKTILLLFTVREREIPHEQHRSR